MRYILLSIMVVCVALVSTYFLHNTFGESLNSES